MGNDTPRPIHSTQAESPPIQQFARTISQAPAKLALSLCLLAGVTAHANLIQNGSFEAPVQPRTGLWIATPTDWTGGGLIFQGTVSGWPSPQDGIQFADIGGEPTPALTQVVQIPQAGSYTLTWNENEAFGFSYSYSVLLNGILLANPSGVGSVTWTQESLEVDLSAGDNTLAFKGLGFTDTLLDNLRLEPTAAPDASSTFSLLTLALGGLAALRRRLP